MLLFTFILLAVFQIKHFLADYILQNKYMLGKFKPGWDFVGPLLAHSGVHGASTLIICIVCGVPELWWLGLVDIALHFIMDRIKAGPKYLGRFKALSGSEMIEIARQNEEWNPPKNTDNQSVIEYMSKMKKRYDNNQIKIKHNTYFWWSLGFDQLYHHLTNYAFIYIIITNM